MSDRKDALLELAELFIRILGAIVAVTYILWFFLLVLFAIKYFIL